MPKHIELPPRVAQAFVRDMRAFFRAQDQLKQDEIASRQLHALIPLQRPRDKRLRLVGRKRDVPTNEKSRLADEDKGTLMKSTLSLGFTWMQLRSVGNSRVVQSSVLFPIIGISDPL